MYRGGGSALACKGIGSVGLTRQQYLLLCGHTLDEAEESSIANGHFVADNEL